jgi:hypothetical protein
VAICARWESQLHLEVDDIAALPIFKNTLVLQFSEYKKAESSNFTALLRYVIHNSVETSKSIIAINLSDVLRKQAEREPSLLL